MFKKRNDFIYVQKYYPDKVYKQICAFITVFQRLKKSNLSLLPLLIKVIKTIQAINS